MGLGHEKLDVYNLSIGYVAWVYEKAEGLTGNHRSARYQWLRVSQSISLNIAEGNGKTQRRSGDGILRSPEDQYWNVVPSRMSWSSAKRWMYKNVWCVRRGWIEWPRC
jgi:hypothetical protein